jgi:soluble lytic murein transglycosylase
VRRRRRGALIGLSLLAFFLALIFTAPLLRRAVDEFTLPLRYQDIIRVDAAAEHLDPAFVAAVIYAETKFDPRTSPAGAVGLMQIEPATAEFLARRTGGYAFHVADLATPTVNIKYGCYYLRYLLDEYDGNARAALAAYNGGETNVNRWLTRAGESARRFELSDIPFPETRAYVQRVLQAQRDYRSKYPTELGYR